ncbi:MAG TPA: sigma 54-interacting transcriptional regulator [Polyangiaceae bacterium]
MPAEAETKAASGPASARLEIAVFDGDRVTSCPLPAAGSLTIGRLEGNDIRLDNAAVSRRHAIFHVGPPLAIQDLGGSNGTFVKDATRASTADETLSLRQVAGATLPIALGDCIVLGTTLLVVRRAEASSVVDVERIQAGRLVSDPVMVTLYEHAARAAASNISVLILGETGVGKEVLARAIHASSPRARQAFLGLNCAALPESLLESELFGHEKGAFSGANQARKGLFESADGGTVFLDEVGELPASMQVKLLRVLEDKSVLPVGGRSPRSIDVRFVAATNRDPELDVAEGRFRQDLFYRLNGFVLTIPPLRDRRSEIAPLANVFAESAASQMGRKAVPRLLPEAVALLEGYRWPGNVRELRNVIERAVVLAAGDDVLPEHLPPKLFDSLRSGQAALSAERRSGSSLAPQVRDSLGKLKEQMRDLERARILDALERCDKNQTKAAELLGMSRRTLVTRLGEYALPRPRKSRE